MDTDRSELARGDIKEPVKGEDWFVTFTVLDFSGALHSSHLRRLGAAVAQMWMLTLRGVTDRSKSRVLGM
jgi:hypothetical protein